VLIALNWSDFDTFTCSVCVLRPARSTTRPSSTATSTRSRWWPDLRCSPTRWSAPLGHHLSPSRTSCASATASTASAPDPLAAQDLLAGDGRAHQGDGENEHSETRAPQDGASPPRCRAASSTSASPASDQPRRELCCHPRPAKGIVPLDKLGWRRAARAAQAHDRRRRHHPVTGRPAAADHDALLDPQPHQLRRHQRDDARGPGRVPDDLIRQTSFRMRRSSTRERIRAMMRQDPDVILVARSATRDREMASAPR